MYEDTGNTSASSAALGRIYRQPPNGLGDLLSSEHLRILSNIPSFVKNILRFFYFFLNHMSFVVPVAPVAPVDFAIEIVADV